MHRVYVYMCGRVHVLEWVCARIKVCADQGRLYLTEHRHLYKIYHITTECGACQFNERTYDNDLGYAFTSCLSIKSIKMQSHLR